MKRSKRFLALLLAVVLVFSLGLTAFANPMDAPGMKEIDGDGKIIGGDFEDEEFICWLPTGLSLDFILDPKGLVGMGVGQFYDPENPPETHGVYFDSTAMFTIVSESSFDIALDVEFTAIDVGGGVNFIDSNGTFDESEGGFYTNDLAIWFTVAKDALMDTSSLFDTVGLFSGGDVNRYLDGDGEAAFSFILDKVPYVYEVIETVTIGGREYASKFDFVKRNAAINPFEGRGTQIVPDGDIGQKGSWTGYFSPTGAPPANTLSLKAKFIAAKFEGEKKDYEFVDDAYGLVEETGITKDEADVADVAITNLDVVFDAPVFDETPEAGPIDNAQWTAAIEWFTGTGTGTPFSGSEFLGGSVYTARVTVTPKAGFTLTGVAEDTFTVNSDATVHAADTGVFTFTFDATDAVAGQFMFLSGAGADDGFYIAIVADNNAGGITSSFSNVQASRAGGTPFDVSTAELMPSGWLKITWSNIQAAGAAAGNNFEWVNGTEFSIFFTHGGVNYKATGIAQTN
ncbi:MAG: hypothetical protein FWE14_07405 [Lachnospiraceae bacterium]|nr:hypothetical protein [Lachnospiraceae bacterium]